MSYEEFSLVLRYVNVVRKRCGLKRLSIIPPGAAPNSSEEIGRLCPLARSIPNTVIAVEYARTADRATADALSKSFGKPIQTLIEFPGEFVVDLPHALLDFVACYDRGELPQFIKKT